MTNASNTKAFEASDMGKLLDNAVQNGEKAVSISADLTIAACGAMKSGSIDPAETYAWLQSTDKKVKAEYLTNLCELYSAKYKAAQDGLEISAKDENKERKLASGKTFRRQIASARLALTRALTSGYWLFKLDALKVTVTPDGNLKIRHENDEYDGLFSNATILKNAETKFKAPGAKRAVRTPTNATPSTDPTITLRTAAEYVSASVAGKGAADFSGEAKNKLMDALVALMGVFGTDANGEMDMEKIVSIYENEEAAAA